MVAVFSSPSEQRRFLTFHTEICHHVFTLFGVEHASLGRDSQHRHHNSTVSDLRKLQLSVARYGTRLMPSCMRTKHSLCLRHLMWTIVLLSLVKRTLVPSSESLLMMTLMMGGVSHAANPTLKWSRPVSLVAIGVAVAKPLRRAGKVCTLRS